MRDHWYTERVNPPLRRFVTDAREWLVPEFQRPYVWQESDRAMLVDSICRDIPIGQVLLWCPERWARPYILDGQQRVTSLVRLSDPDETDSAFHATVPIAEHEVPFHLLLSGDTMVLGRWCTAHRLDGRRGQAAFWRLVERVRDFDVGCTVVYGPESYARDVYERVNSTGITVDLDQRRIATDECPSIAKLIASARSR